MLQSADYPVADALALLGRHGIDAALLVPTPTGLSKAILDATEGLREYLRETGYHDYDAQGQGQDHAVKREVEFVTATGLVPSKGSFYRPETKKGDPRIWLGIQTKERARAGNLLALSVIAGKLYVLNMSDPSVRASIADPQSPLRRLARDVQKVSSAADELLGLLRGVSALGFVPTLRPGDTGVGMTLETHLGINANSARDPDFKGIELKARRQRKRGSVNRSTLFSKVPAWRLSPVGSALGLLSKRGYLVDGRLQLYHELSGLKPNSRGLMLEVDAAAQWLKQVHVDQDGQREHDVTWELPALEADLAAKHRETFWVSARCRGTDAGEEFHYVEVQHTRQPLVRNLGTLLEAGVVTVDYLLHLKGERARDHGYLFKIHPSNIEALFPPPEVHPLA